MGEGAVCCCASVAGWEPRRMPRESWRPNIATTERFLLGSRATCAEGRVGTLTALVVGRAEGGAGNAPGYLLTHLVVEPTGRVALGRLVPLPLAHAA